MVLTSTEHASKDCCLTPESFSQKYYSCAQSRHYDKYTNKYFLGGWSMRKLHDLRAVEIGKTEKCNPGSTGMNWAKPV